MSIDRGLCSPPCTPSGHDPVPHFNVVLLLFLLLQLVRAQLFRLHRKRLHESCSMGGKRARALRWLRVAHGDSIPSSNDWPVLEYVLLIIATEQYYYYLLRGGQ